MFSIFEKTKKNKPNTTKFNKKNIRKTKKMVCNPIVAGKTVSNDTCYTPKFLYKIKMEYNKQHLDNPIIAKHPTKIWHELHDRLTLCSKEDCWLRQIDDVNLRNQINEHIFAPKQPPEWKNNPNEWLSNIDIIDVLEQYEEKYTEFKLIGPTFIDFDAKLKDSCVDNELCNFSLLNYIKKGENKIGVIFNLDRHDQSGSHWVSLFIDIQDKFIFYFDSAGNKIPKEIRHLVIRIMKQGKKMRKPVNFKFYQNYPFEHQMGNTECGMYSLFFMITMLTNKMETQPTHNSHSSGSMTEGADLNVHRFKNAAEKIYFFKNERITDEFVEKLRAKYYNV